MKHTKEPWVISATKDRTSILNLYPEDNKPWELQAQATSEANAARIVECVNALEGMADPAEVIQAFLAFLDYAYSNPAPNIELWKIEQRALRAIKGSL